MTLAHHRVGSGPRFVLHLHGWFGSARGWGLEFPQLLDTDTCTHVYVDYRGYGGSIDQAGDYTIDEIAGDVLTLADSLGATTFSLVGHSMGGSAAQRVLALAPERVDRLVGISPVPASGVPFDEEGWALFSGAAQDDGNRAAIIDFTTGNRLTHTWVDAMVRHSVECSTREAFGAYLRSWSGTDFSQEVAGKELPVLAIVGEHDPALGEATIQETWMRSYPNARLEVLRNAGHYAMHETPVALATSVDRFLGD